MTEHVTPEEAAALLEGTTPGPWHAYYNVHGDPFVVTDPARPSFTQLAMVSTEAHDYGKADARLIAAAPRLAATVAAGATEGPSHIDLIRELRECLAWLCQQMEVEVVEGTRGDGVPGPFIDSIEGWVPIPDTFLPLVLDAIKGEG